MSAIEALYIFDTYAPTQSLLLTHTWRSRPSASPSSLYQAYLATPAPRPALLYLPSTAPPTLLFNITHTNLLLLSPATSEIEPLLVLEFLHKVVDVLEDYLGSPLLGNKLEANYDIVAQLLNEMADDGFPFTTEPNALRDLVLPPSLIGKLLSNVTGQALSNLPSLSSSSGSHTPQLSTIPWRRSNVKHTSNELYVDIIETLTAVLAPSGRPLALRTSGSIAFTSKLSGIPDLTLNLTVPGAKTQILGGLGSSGLDYPVFHPCVRLTRWKERPGELSFIPPDGKFLLASYEVDLLPNSWGGKKAAAASPMRLPVEVELSTLLGEAKDEFEVRIFVSTTHLAPTSSSSTSSPALGFGSRAAARSPAFGGSSNSPVVEEVTVTIPLPRRVKALAATRCSRGDWHQESAEVVWRIPLTGGFSTNGGTATFRTGVQVRGLDDEEGDEEADEEKEKKNATRKLIEGMPRVAVVNFTVKGWLPSGVKVEGLKIGGRVSEGIKPYKGVKYISKGRVEARNL